MRCPEEYEKAVETESRKIEVVKTKKKRKEQKAREEGKDKGRTKKRRTMKM